MIDIITIKIAVQFYTNGFESLRSFQRTTCNYKVTDLSVYVTMEKYGMVRKICGQWVGAVLNKGHSQEHQITAGVLLISHE